MLIQRQQLIPGCDNAYEVPLERLRGAILNIIPVSKSERFRLVDCRALIERQTLVIYEAHEVPKTIRYTILMGTINKSKWQLKVHQPDSPNHVTKFWVDFNLKAPCDEAHDGYLWIPNLCMRPGDETDSR